MRVTEKLVKSPEEEGVTLAYIRLTKDFEEIKEYVQHKGDTLTGYKKARERASVRIEDILCQTAHCGRCKLHFVFGEFTSPIVPYRNLPQAPDGMTADCCSLV